MAPQKVKQPATQCDNLCSIPRTHMGGENQLHKLPLTHTHLHTQSISKFVKKWAGEAAQQQRAVCLWRGPAPTWWLTTVCDFNFRDLTPCSDLRHQAHM